MSNMNGLLNNPLLHIGLGLLGQGQSRDPGQVGIGAGVRQGLLSYGQQQKYQVEQQALAQEQAYKTAQMNDMQQKMAMEQAKWDQEQSLYNQQQAALNSLGPNVTDAQKAALLMGGAPAAQVIKDMGRGGNLEGTSLEVQAVNDYVNTLPPDQRAAARSDLMRQELMREKTVVTPAGTRFIQGFDLGGGTPGAALSSQSGLVPSTPSEGARKDLFAANNMLSFATEADTLENSEGFDPASAEAAAASMPGSAKFISPQADQYNSAKKQWSTMMVMLISGATAREDEVATAMETYFPRYGADSSTVANAKSRRNKAMINAYEKAAKDGRIAREEADSGIAKIRASMSGGATLPEGDVMKRADQIINGG